MSGAQSAEVAAALLAEFGSLRGVLAASRRRLRRVVDDGRVAVHIGAVRAALEWSLRSAVDERPIINSERALTNYLRFAQGVDQIEVLRVLYLDSRLRLLREEVAARGTVDEAPIYVREILRRALDIGAVGLVMVHNHPSGDTSPSTNDIAVTRRLAEGGRAMGIEVHDHLIVSGDACTSLRAEGLI